MQQKNNNIYQNARRAAGLTQERAAEVLGLSVRSIADYESGLRVPPNEVVSDMVMAYNSQLLAVRHLRASASCARDVLPEVEDMRLPEAVLTLIDAIYDFADDKLDRELIEIARDGIIDADERPRFQRIISKIREIIAAAMAVSCAETSNKQS